MDGDGSHMLSEGCLGGIHDMAFMNEGRDIVDTRRLFCFVGDTYYSAFRMLYHIESIYEHPKPQHPHHLPKPTSHISHT
jgi:hypothetical protein